MKNNIKITRKQRNLTQEALAELTRLTVRTISRLENGLQNPNPSTLYILCQVLETTPEELGYEDLNRR